MEFNKGDIAILVFLRQEKYSPRSSEKGWVIRIYGLSDLHLENFQSATSDAFVLDGKHLKLDALSAAASTGPNNEEIATFLKDYTIPPFTVVQGILGILGNTINNPKLTNCSCSSTHGEGLYSYEFLWTIT